MNIKIISGCLFALASVAPAYADDVDIADIAARTGLSERQVRMVLGPHTPYAEYRTSYDMAERRVADAILEDQLHPAVTVGEIDTTTVAPASTVTETTTTTTYPATESSTTNSTQFKSDDADDNASDDDEYDNDDVDDE